MSQPHILHSALTESITSGRFVDTKFYVFSRRHNSGRVGTPKALFANGRVLATVPYFESLFSERFSEGESKDIRDGFPSDEQPYTDTYEYLSDSDLDEEEECTGVDEPANNDTATNNPFLSPGIAAPDRECGGTVHMQQGKVAIVKDMAAITFKALLGYLYTGEIHFAPFGSEANRNLRASGKQTWETDGLSKVSPKSIYRLADKYDIPELKQLAWETILKDLNSCNLVEEIFSDFTFFFPQGASEDTIKRLQEKLSNLSGVRLERSADTLGILWEKLSKSEPFTVEKEQNTGPSIV
ncbi:hypothetical protein BJ322DRAFT_349753 [Thelephora terrestris]|uniref:BTB domain-containing protein n=1 Tax=Thelephora terrestris TaxID=56493 RepID=A0A9P6H5M1_9AGAM|nr:hypothetical protein BJ322DRAFT_349753 [Thelephora terrestris]